jgi:quinol monooxygenase YgiN
MATIFVRHRVADFATWNRAYDDFDAERATMGVTGHGVYQVDGEPNEVVLYHHFESMDAAKTFMANPRLQQIMAAAGVQGEPTVWFTNRV